MARRFQTLLLALLLALPGAAARAEPGWSDDERQRILGLGPWPPALRPDPGNRVSGQAQAIELGRRLFSDPRMSPVGYIACVTCHQPDRSFTDNKARGHGLADLPRNTPALANLGQRRWYGWGGASDSLWMASIRPILDAREFDGSPDSVARLFERDPELAACYRQVFQEQPQADPQRTIVNVGKALAAFQETLVTGRTAFDDFRDALARGDLEAAATYPIAAQRGLRLFVGRARCVACHSGPDFSDGEFHPGFVQSPGAPRAITKAARDTGRLDDARGLKASRLNLLGPHNDDPSRANAVATRSLVVREAMRGRFRTPGLRNVALTGPYLHDGSIDRLQDALRHALPAPPGSRSVEPLSTGQADDLSAFLATLTDPHGERRPWSTDGLTGCP